MISVKLIDVTLFRKFYYPKNSLIKQKKSVFKLVRKHQNTTLVLRNCDENSSLEHIKAYIKSKYLGRVELTDRSKIIIL